MLLFPVKDMLTRFDFVTTTPWQPSNKRNPYFVGADGSTSEIDWAFKDVYRDKYTRETLPDAQIREAIIDKM